MDFELTDDQMALRDGLRRFLDDRVTPEARRATGELPGAVDRDLWRDLGGIGVFAVTVPEEDGGAGLGMADATIVFEELGRVAVPGPLVGTFLAAGLRSELADLAREAAAGGAVVGLTPVTEPAYVEHLAALDDLLVVSEAAVTLAGPPRRSRPVERPLDPLTPVDLVDALPSGRPIGGAVLAARLGTAAGLLAAALQVGLAEAAVSLATAHAAVRRQFGRVIGGFQAVKHLLADARVGVDVARSAVQAAGVEIDDAGAAGAPAAQAQRAADAARIVASRAADRATRTCVQVHGGMGFTWEHDAHLLLKRALVLDVGVRSVDEAAESLAAAL
ncbi:MAG TPA: acyl-CoA dehydrogenase family protein [Acidimicrobiales bacterium]